MTDNDTLNAIEKIIRKYYMPKLKEEIINEIIEQTSMKLSAALKINDNIITEDVKNIKDRLEKHIDELHDNTQYIEADENQPIKPEQVRAIRGMVNIMLSNHLLKYHGKSDQEDSGWCCPAHHPPEIGTGYGFFMIGNVGNLHQSVIVVQQSPPLGTADCGRIPPVWCIGSFPQLVEKYRGRMREVQDGIFPGRGDGDQDVAELELILEQPLILPPKYDTDPSGYGMRPFDHLFDRHRIPLIVLHPGIRDAGGCNKIVESFGSILQCPWPYC